MQILIDLVRALKGLSRLLRFDPSYRDYFDPTLQGTWRSFFAMMLVAPTVALTMPDDPSKIYPNATQFEILAVQILLYVIGWFAIPLVLLELGRWFKRDEAMPSYITIYNWFQLINLPLAMAIWFGETSGSGAIYSLLALLSLAVYLTYLFHIARSFLRVEIYVAAIFVATDFAISLLLELSETMLLVHA